MHRHECPSFFMPLSGAFVEGCGTVVRRYVAGEVGYHPPHEPHWLQTQGVAAHGFAVEVGAESRETFGTTFGEPTAWDAAPRDLSRSRVSWLMGQLYLELRTQDTARPLVVQALSAEVGAELRGELQRELMRAQGRPPHWLLQIRERLHEEPYETPSLTALARLAGITPAGMIKTFRRYEGCTPGDYLRTLRLTHARTALGGSDRPVGAIALDAGFYDQSHFTRAFRRAMGVTPLAYRRLLRE